MVLPDYKRFWSHESIFMESWKSSKSEAAWENSHDGWQSVKSGTGKHEQHNSSHTKCLRRQQCFTELGELRGKLSFIFLFYIHVLCIHV